MGWQVTATTVRCDWVDDFAVIMVYADKTAKCAYVNRWGSVAEGKKKLSRCKWPECPLVREHQEQMLSL